MLTSTLWQGFFGQHAIRYQRICSTSGVVTHASGAYLVTSDCC